MTTLCELSNSKIKIFGGQREHPPPHCHLKGPNTNCSIDLATFEVTKGKYDRKDLSEALEWLAVAENYALVVNEWRRLNDRE
jgi:hypothetical protein